MPVEIRNQFTEMPLALTRHAGAIGLSLADVGFVQLLQSYKWYADSTISASMETLAGHLNTSVHTVSRHVSRLEKAGFLIVNRASSSKRAPVKSYDLAPLWDALAAVVNESKPHLHVVVDAARVLESENAVRDSADRPISNLPIEVHEGEADDSSTAAACAHEAEGGMTLAEDEEPLLEAGEAFYAKTQAARRIRLAAGEEGLYPWERRKLMQEAADLKAEAEREYAWAICLADKDQEENLEGSEAVARTTAEIGNDPLPDLSEAHATVSVTIAETHSIAVAGPRPPGLTWWEEQEQQHARGEREEAERRERRREARAAQRSVLARWERHEIDL